MHKQSLRLTRLPGNMTRHRTAMMLLPWPRSTQRTRFGLRPKEQSSEQYAEYFKFGRHSNHTTTFDPASYQITGTTDKIALSGGWSVTVEVQGKPQEFKGRWLARP